MKKQGLLMIVVAGGMMVGLSGTASANLITNGSFESTTSVNAFTTLNSGSTAIVGWTVGGHSVDWIGSYWVSSDWDKSLDLSGSGRGAITSNSFATTSGTTYKVTFDMAGNPYQNSANPTDKNLKVTVGSQEFNFSFNTFGKTTTLMGWETQTFSFVATGAATSLSFIDTTTTGSEYAGVALDNVTVNPVPVPAAFLLFGSGLLGLLGLRRKND